jgi:hypothetical protein
VLGDVVYGFQWRFLILLLWALVGFVLSFCLALLFFPFPSLFFWCDDGDGTGADVCAKESMGWRRSRRIAMCTRMRLSSCSKKGQR